MPCGTRWPFSSISYCPPEESWPKPSPDACPDLDSIGASTTFCSEFMLPLPLAQSIQLIRRSRPVFPSAFSPQELTESCNLSRLSPAHRPHRSKTPPRRPLRISTSAHTPYRTQRSTLSQPLSVLHSKRLGFDLGTERPQAYRYREALQRVSFATRFSRHCLGETILTLRPPVSLLDWSSGCSGLRQRRPLASSTHNPPRSSMRLLRNGCDGKLFSS